MLKEIFLFSSLLFILVNCGALTALDVHVNKGYIVLHCTPQCCFVPAEIPHWLSVYSRASAELDHKLRWEMFRLPELDCFNAMLTRLYKQELEEIVMRYEAYRSVSVLTKVSFIVI